MNRDFFIAAVEGQMRHAGYSTAEKIEKWAKAMSTGEGQDDYLPRKRENAAQKKQRKELTKTLTTFSLNRVRRYWAKIARAEEAPPSFTWSGDPDEQILSSVQKNFADFSDGRSLRDWLIWRCESLGATDPNTWLFFLSKKQFDLAGIPIAQIVYPYVVPSSNVLYFKKDETGKIQFVLYCVLRTEQGKNGVETLTDYYSHSQREAYSLREIGPQTAIQEGEEAISIKIGNQDKRFYFAQYEPNHTEVPGAPIGAYTYELAGHDVYTTPFEPARFVLYDLITDKSLSDVVKMLHAFPRRTEYVKRCTHQEDGLTCENGYFGTGQTRRMCSHCNGTGKVQVRSTEQEVVTLAMPTKGSELLELSKLSHTESYDLGFPEFLATQIEIGERRVAEAVFSSGIVKGATGGAEKTATEVNYEYSDIYDTLEPFADRVSELIQLAHRVAFQYYGKQVEVRHAFPKDFRMKPMSELLADYQSLQTIGAPVGVLQNLMEKIVEKSTEGKGQEALKIKTQQSFLPWSDKTAEELMLILTGRAYNDPERFLRENFVRVFDEIDQLYGLPFYTDFARSKQREVINQIVSGLIQNVVSNDATL